ncbi:hypothetical protein [Burkholderia ambifaria]|uniref:hypothetical protein n=1 Tax=Burkholderia ambifaria TaxID=152480 RepID=UPI002010D333|nr:hypothetical protein [Burkholderia ambifaria]
MNRGVEPTRRNARFSARAESFPAANEASSGFSEADSIGLGRIAVQVAALGSEHGGQLGRMGIGPTENCTGLHPAARIRSRWRTASFDGSLIRGIAASSGVRGVTVAT